MLMGWAGNKGKRGPGHGDQEAAKRVISSTHHPFLSGLRPAMNDEEDCGIR